nr:hypothetical protein [Streptomyces microflavus]
MPHDLHPVALRDELIELGDLFRAYQQRPEPDLAELADLHSRKAKAFRIWAEVSGVTELVLEARRAEQAADAALLQHQQRTGQSPVDEGEVTNRLLPGLTQWEHARTVLAHVAEHTPLPGPEARLMAVMLTLRSALTGTGNLVGQDVRGLPLTDPEELIGRLVDSGWLSIPGTADDLLESRPESPTPITIPSLMPGETDRARSTSAGRRVPSSAGGPSGSSVTRSSARRRPVPPPGSSPWPWRSGPVPTDGWGPTARASTWRPSPPGVPSSPTNWSLWWSS